MIAHYRKARISPKKANLIASMVRGKKAVDAMDTLQLLPKKAARILYRVIQSAVSNAENNFKQKADDLLISKIIVTKGPAFTRYIPISRGRVHPVLKKTSHLSVEVNVQAEKKITEKTEKNAESTEKKKGEKAEKKAEKKEEKKPRTKDAEPKPKTTAKKKTEPKKQKI